MKTHKIIVYVKGGVVQDVEIPIDVKNKIRVEIHDYDIQEIEAHTEIDKEGKPYNLDIYK